MSTIYRITAPASGRALPEESPGISLLGVGSIQMFEVKRNSLTSSIG
ncbi:MAG: hypothetical protein OJF50_005733 [Nitrospira sp.]|nr:hypothetical protein [Nitrospira sp.]